MFNNQFSKDNIEHRKKVKFENILPYCQPIELFCPMCPEVNFLYIIFYL